MSQHKSLLAHIASNFISEYENVANSSTAYLLNEYAAAREALRGLLEVSEVPHIFKTELATKSNGRPDVTGLNINGEKSIIIEGKFWANLTDNQPVNYLKELPADGKLLFLAPSKRIASLKIELTKRIGSDDNRVLARSWNEFLTRVEEENNKNHNAHLASDLLQMRELCQKMDTEGMPPLSASDLDPMNGKISSHFADILVESNSVIRTWNETCFKGQRVTPSTYGIGTYFMYHNLACHLQFDAQKWFLRQAHTPFWLRVRSDNADKVEIVNHYLHTFDPINSKGNEYGITLQPGMDKDQVIKHITAQTKELLEYIHAHLTNS